MQNSLHGTVRFFDIVLGGGGGSAGRGCVGWSVVGKGGGKGGGA